MKSETLEAVEATTPNKVNNELVKSLKEDLEKLNETLKNKVYPVKIENEATLVSLISFMDNDAKWRDMEALGIIEISKALKEQSGKIKNGNIFLKNLPIDAASYFLSKHESTGLNHAEKHIKFSKALHDALKLVKADTIEVNKLEMNLHAAENGIAVAETVESNQFKLDL